MSSWYLASGARLDVPGQGAVNAELWARFVAGADSHYAETGIRTQVNSVMRSTADQRRFWDAYVAYLSGGPWAPLAARPGSSNHERGLAVDAQPANRGADFRWQQFFRAVGLHFPVSGEAWHVELAPVRSPLPNPPIPVEDDVIPAAQMTELKQWMEHVVLKVLPRDQLDVVKVQTAAVFSAVFPSGSVNAPNRFDRIEDRLVRLERQRTGIIWRVEGVDGEYWGMVGGRVYGPLTHAEAVEFKRQHDIVSNSIVISRAWHDRYTA